MGAHKFFVLDTNVILHDSSCIKEFDEHDLVIPITVIEELDQFKKGNESINFHAREFLRTIDTISSEGIFDKGVPLGDNRGKLFILLEKPIHDDIKLSFIPGKPDNHILNCAYYLMLAEPKRNVILLSKDVNLRMKAKSIGLCAEDYTADRVKDISRLYTGHRTTENLPFELINEIYQNPVPIETELFEPPLTANEYLIMKNHRKSALSVYHKESGTLKHVEKIAAYQIVPKNAEQTFALDALLNDEIKLISITGKAGTGKTLLSLAAALEIRKNYKQIFLARPIVPLSNKDVGFLPGDIDAKLAPYMQSLYDNLTVIKNQFKEADKKYQRIQELQKENKLVIEPLSYIRGRSLDRIYFIVDEAQNLTPHEIKTIITRAGEGTKIVLTGDIFQIDHPYLDTESNGLSYLIEKMRGQHLYAHINLEKGERSELAELASNLL